MINNKIFAKTYLDILSEQVDQNKKEEDQLSPVDDLAKQNITTIAEQDGDNEQQESTASTTNDTTQIEVTSEEDDEQNEQNEEQDDPNDGWGDQIEEQLHDIMTDMDSFIYEIKNCVKGAYTNAKNKQELSEYIIDLSERLRYIGENL